MIFARRFAFALLLAGFRMWRRLPAKDRRLVVDALRKHGPRVASSVARRRFARR